MSSAFKDNLSILRCTPFHKKLLRIPIILIFCELQNFYDSNTTLKNLILKSYHLQLILTIWDGVDVFNEMPNQHTLSHFYVLWVKEFTLTL